MLPELIPFVLGTLVLAWLSRKPLRQPGSHGFYRFFAWECILALVVMNHRVWGTDPWSLHQFSSWLLMLASIALVVAGITTLRQKGQARERADGESFYEWEKTTSLVTSGIFGYIRHPMYASLLALTWGAFLQNPSITGLLIADAGSVMLYLTARRDEVECLAYFGQPYADYMKRTKGFIPGLL